MPDSRPPDSPAGRLNREPVALQGAASLQGRIIASRVTARHRSLRTVEVPGPQAICRWEALAEVALDR